MELTYAIAMAAGQDAGNRSMRRAGRSAWSAEDWDVAAELTNRLLRYGSILSKDSNATAQQPIQTKPEPTPKPNAGRSPGGSRSGRAHAGTGG